MKYIKRSYIIENWILEDYINLSKQELVDYEYKLRMFGYDTEAILNFIMYNNNVYTMLECEFILELVNNKVNARSNIRHKWNEIKEKLRAKFYKLESV